MRTSRMAVATLLALGVAAGGLRDASAELGAIHPELLKAAAVARASKGPEIYANLREVWRMWDRADPAHVEEALGSLGQSASNPSAKVYAELLGAYARRRRGDLDGAQARIAKLGFVSRWMTLGPFE